MAKGTFLNVLPYVFEEEGGYVNHPADPGGHTNMGITLATLSAWMGTKASAADIRNLSQKTAADIYKKNYWDKIAGDVLPAGIDYAVFDFAINSGPARAAKALQKIAGTSQDGLIGDQTLSALNLRDPPLSSIISVICGRTGCKHSLPSKLLAKAGPPVSNAYATVPLLWPMRLPASLKKQNQISRGKQKFQSRQSSGNQKRWHRSAVYSPASPLWPPAMAPFRLLSQLFWLF